MQVTLLGRPNSANGYHDAAFDRHSENTPTIVNGKPR
jgi:hypothetical protein